MPTWKITFQFSNELYKHQMGITYADSETIYGAREKARKKLTKNLREGTFGNYVIIGVELLKHSQEHLPE